MKVKVEKVRLMKDRGLSRDSESGDMKMFEEVQITYDWGLSRGILCDYSDSKKRHRRCW